MRGSVVVASVAPVAVAAAVVVVVVPVVVVMVVARTVVAAGVAMVAVGGRVPVRGCNYCSRAAAVAPIAVPWALRLRSCRLRLPR